MTKAAIPQLSRNSLEGVAGPAPAPTLSRFPGTGIPAVEHSTGSVAQGPVLQEHPCEHGHSAGGVPERREQLHPNVHPHLCRVQRVQEEESNNYYNAYLAVYGECLQA